MIDGPAPWATGGFAAGSRIGGYRLEERIGQGGMAVVFRAYDERLDRAVALKILAPTLAMDAEFRHRFIRESRAAAAVDDPNIIPVFEAGDADGVLFIATRLVRGGDLRSLVASHGPLTPARAAWITSAVASALDAAHAAGLVHRDVKPANMLLDVRPGRPDHVYLSDFGLSKGSVGSSSLTGRGQFLGTVDYAAPEQIEGRRVDGRTDQYALGCSAFELLCGQPPFRRDAGLAAMYAHLAAAPPSLAALRAELPGAVDHVFAKVLAKSPEDRFGNCHDFASALRQTLGMQAYGSEDTDWPGRAAAGAALLAFGGHRQAQIDAASDHARTDPSVADARSEPDTGRPLPWTGPSPAADTEPSDILGQRPTTGRGRLSDGQPSGSQVPTAAPAAGRLWGPKRPPGRPAGTTDRTAPPSRLGHSRRRARLLAAAVIACVAAGGTGTAIALAHPHQRPAVPAALTQLAGPQRYHSLVVTRRWVLSGPAGSLLTETISVTDAGAHTVRATVRQAIPSGTVPDLATLRYVGPPGVIAAADRAVRWLVVIPSARTVVLGYRAQIARLGATARRLARIVSGFSAPVVLAARPPGATGLRSLVIRPSVIRLVPGGTFTARLAGRLSNGKAAPRSMLARASWMTGNASVATVSAAGTVTAIAQGTTTLFAQLGSATASAVVVVSAGPQPNPTPSYASPSPSPSQPTPTSSQPSPTPSTITPSTLAPAAGRRRR